MKIWGDIPKVLGNYDKQKNVSRVDKASSVVSKKDVVSISNKAKDFQTAMKAAKDAPDIRSEKVNELIDRYESGNYNVSGKDVADKVINSMLDTKA
jgi:negative regulator of flagellin synthesis FlgM